MANRTVIIKENRNPASDDDTSLWVILLVAFAVAMIAFVGYRTFPSRAEPTAPAPQQQTPAATP